MRRRKKAIKMATTILDAAVKYWVQETFVLLLGIIGWIWGKLNKQRKEYNALKHGIRA